MLRRTFSTHFETGAHFFSFSCLAFMFTRVGRFNKRFLLVVPSRRKTGREEKHEAEREEKTREGGARSRRSGTRGLARLRRDRPPWGSGCPRGPGRRREGGPSARARRETTLTWREEPSRFSGLHAFVRAVPRGKGSRRPPREGQGPTATLGPPTLSSRRTGTGARGTSRPRWRCSAGPSGLRGRRTWVA